MIGWDEIAAATLLPTSIVQHWRPDAAKAELSRAPQLILSPADRAYLDMKYDAETALGLKLGGAHPDPARLRLGSGGARAGGAGRRDPGRRSGALVRDDRQHARRRVPGLSPARGDRRDRLVAAGRGARGTASARGSAPRGRAGPRWASISTGRRRFPGSFRPVPASNDEASMPRRVLLISTYDLGRQPFGLASPAAWLRQAGHAVSCVDATRTRLTDEMIGDAAVVAFYLPMHTATRLALPLSIACARLNPASHLVRVRPLRAAQRGHPAAARRGDRARARVRAGADGAGRLGSARRAGAPRRRPA